MHQDGRPTRSAASCDFRSAHFWKEAVLDNGEITSVKLLWKPEVVDAPIQSEIPPQPATSISHLGPWAHIKKKCSASSWRRSKQRLENFLEKRNCQKRQECTTSFGEVLQGSHNIVYETNRCKLWKEWSERMGTNCCDYNYGKELGVKEMETCKKIVYFQNENGPQFSIRKGKCQFPTPIARWTRSRLKSETP